MTAPRVTRLAGEARKVMTSARSAGATQRRWSASGIAARFAGVSRTEGATALTQISSSVVSCASAWVSAATADLDGRIRRIGKAVELGGYQVRHVADRIAGAQRRDDRPAEGARATSDDDVAACEVNHGDDPRCRRFGPLWRVPPAEARGELVGF